MKPASYSQLYIHIIFAVGNQNASITPAIRKHIFMYLDATITQMGHKSIIVNGTSNHVHLFFGLNPNKSISETVLDLKQNSALFINEAKLCPDQFYWQAGYGAFSYSHSNVVPIYYYILNQHIHHRTKSFREEYICILEKFEINYDERYLFDFWDQAE
ncbi:transposase [Mangrovibacterium lignilyticum]|uniref:transposase n=1 Tax=Mangrovibacterium lignilyticum TaxID=2668052 RepID=UPI0013D35F6D|nr:transposase [Mangrovibacterium lignilyticum]